MAFKKRLLCCRLDCPRSPCAAVEAERDWLPELLDELRRRLPELPVFTGTEPDDEDASVAGGSEQPAAAYRAPSSHHAHMTLNLLPSSPPLPITHTCTQARCSLCVL